MSERTSEVERTAKTALRNHQTTPRAIWEREKEICFERLDCVVLDGNIDV